MRTNTKSIFDSEIRFYRNKDNDVYVRCTCGWDEVLMKNIPLANDNLVEQMKAAIANHQHSEKQIAA